MLPLNEWKIVILRVAHWSNEQGRLLRFLSFDGSIKWKLMINCKDMNESIMKVSIAKLQCESQVAYLTTFHLFYMNCDLEVWERSFYSHFFFFFGNQTHTFTHWMLSVRKPKKKFRVWCFFLWTISNHQIIFRSKERGDRVQTSVIILSSRLITWFIRGTLSPASTVIYHLLPHFLSF